MKNPGIPTRVKFEWFISFYEKAIPKAPEPKRPTKQCCAHAAQIAYDADPTDVPFCFLDGLPPKGVSRGERRNIAIHRITEWAIEHAPMLRRYMMKEYEVLVVFHDGDLTSKGIRIVPNRSSAENVKAAQAQGAWNGAHCEGTHDCEDFEAEEINRLQPKAAIERHKLVAIPLPKPKGGKK